MSSTQTVEDDLVVETAARHRSSFRSHFFQMFAAMAVGMIITGAIFMGVTGATTWDQITSDYPTQALLAMVAGMTVPMAGWMVYRGMGWRNTAEMVGAMALPVIPFLCLVWFDVADSAQCGAYCIVTVAAMLGLMRYRHSVYSGR